MKFKKLRIRVQCHIPEVPDILSKSKKKLPYYIDICYGFGRIKKIIRKKENSLAFALGINLF